MRAELFLTGTRQWTNYLTVGGAMIGMRTEHSDETVSTRYFHTDSLGSIAAITDEHGVVVERLSYDAWGKRRFVNGTDDPSGSITSQTIRGFTGQEFLADVGLVHLNGRVHDPLVGRMMSADPFVPDPMNGQAWNRYSYVINNPLAFPDPNGYCFLGLCGIGNAVGSFFSSIGNVFRSVPILGSIFRIGAVVICTVTPGCQPFLPVVAAASSAFVAGVTSGRLDVALKAGLIAGATAVAFDAVGSITGDIAKNVGADAAQLFNVGAHALVGCGESVASGGKCGPGALAGAATSAAGPVINQLQFGAALVANAVVGGLASVAGGGKFANGAVTGAFGYLFNHLGHMLVGTDAHHQLLAYLQRQSDGANWSGNTTLGGLFGNGRPDLIYDEMPLQVYEIKPQGAEVAGAAQLQGYLNTPGSQSVAGDFYRIFKGNLSITLTAGWFGTTYTYTPSANLNFPL